MHAELNAQLAFHLIGVRNGNDLETALGLRPALLAGFSDLAALRYDFPLVLADDGTAAPLSALIDQATSGQDAQRRHAALRQEREVRARLAGGLGGRLSSLWKIEPALGVEGDLVDCDALLPQRFFRHAWSAAQARKARRFHDEAERLIAQLAAILAADYVHSDEGRSAGKLAASLASRESIDTRALSRLLAKALPERRLPRARRRRIRDALAALKGQRFFDSPARTFVFHSCAAALQALREREGQGIELARAMATARLEAAGEYVEGEHDALLGQLAEHGVAAALMPDYLVCLNAGNLRSPENASLPDLLGSGMPVKILVQHDDILERSPVGNGPAFGTRARLLAGMALGLNDVYVLQSPASQLYALRERVRAGLEHPGAALFSVYSGAGEHSHGIPAYLMAAAAMESRAFPAFSHAPGSGFALENNPQPEAGWPVHAFAYEDAEHQRVTRELPFTLADFAACDPRYARYFARVPLSSDGEVPSLLMVDEANRLQKVIVSAPLEREAQRCLDAWKALQARVKPGEKEKESPVQEVAAAPVPAATEPEPAAAGKPASDTPWIDTPRCTTCEECVKINAKLFVYDANKQAHIADPKLGTYKELVEAAEACQVSIIHPGQPLDGNEPGLAELVERARPFL
jgi:hypothetical protein